MQKPIGMKAVLFLILSAFLGQTANALYVKTMFKGAPEETNLCCIELAHVYYTNNHQYIAMGTSFASLDDALCCEKETGGVDLDLKSISQFQKDSLDAVYAFNKTEKFQQSVNNVLLRYRLTIEGKKGKIEVSQNPVSGKLILSFIAAKAGKMNLTIEPINNNNMFQDEVEVRAGKNEIEINYVPYASEHPQPPFITYLITLINDNEVLGVTYQHQFR
jgi:hypothetical protein